MSGDWQGRPRRVSYPVLLGLYGVNAAVLLAAQTGQIGEADLYPWRGNERLVAARSWSPFAIHTIP